MMPLYILVTTHQDLENKEVLLPNTYLLVSCLQWEIFQIKYNVCPDSGSRDPVILTDFLASVRTNSLWSF